MKILLTPLGRADISGFEYDGEPIDILNDPIPSELQFTMGFKRMSEKVARSSRSIGVTSTTAPIFKFRARVVQYFDPAGYEYMIVTETLKTRYNHSLSKESGTTGVTLSELALHEQVIVLADYLVFTDNELDLDKTISFTLDRCTNSARLSRIPLTYTLKDGRIYFKGNENPETSIM